MKTVRILPMNGELEFPGKTIEEIQKDFFMKELIERKGVYGYRTKGMESEYGDLVLFQMDNQIIASALFERCVQYPVQTDPNHKGDYWFDPDTIKVFKPISLDELKDYIDELKRFGDVKFDFKITDDQNDSLNKRMDEKK